MNPEGTVLDAAGGAPQTCVGRRIASCDALPGAVRDAATEVLAAANDPRAQRHAVVEVTGGPRVALVVVEAILLHPSEVDLESLLRRVLVPMQMQAESLGVALAFEREGELPGLVMIDGEKLGWAIVTLVGNALRHVRRGSSAGPGGEVAVRLAVSADGRSLRVTVRDDGPGIPAAVRPWLLDPDPDTGSPLGLGLRVVQDVAVAHGGGLIVKSSTESGERGTAMTLCLPVRTARAQPQAVR